MGPPTNSFVLVGIVFAAYCAIINGEEQIRYAAVIYRHGDRTPVNQFPTDPYRNESLWPVRFGELTNTGKMQHYALGKWLRTRYNHLVSEKFDPIEIYVRSTNVDRTLMSAQANLAGMYPPVADSVWNPHLQWQPIPVHTRPENEDEVLSMERKCPNYDIEYKKTINSPVFKNRLLKYNKLMKYLTKYAGFEVQNYDDILNIYSVLKIEQLYNFTLPEWTSAVYPNQMVEPAGYSFKVVTLTSTMARLKMGPFLKDVTHHMGKMLCYHDSTFRNNTEQCEDSHTEPLKLNIYSAHDLNIGSVLNGLKLYDGRCPEYTSTILFELVYDDVTKKHFVRILYRNTTEIVEPILLSIPECGDRCPYENFMKIYGDIIPNDWEKECNEQALVDLVITCIITMLLFFVGSYLCYTYWFENSTRKMIVEYKAVSIDHTSQKPDAVKSNV